MSLQDFIDEAGKDQVLPTVEKLAGDKGELELDKLADLMDKYASIIDGSEKQDAATQHILSAVMDDGMTGEKAQKIQTIRDRLQDMGVVS